MIREGNIKYKVTPLSYVHIGNGSTYDPFSFVIKNGYAYNINQIAYIEYLKKTANAEFNKVLESEDYKSILRYLYDCFDPDNHLYLSRYPVNPDIESIFLEHIKNSDNQNQIWAFTKNAFGVPYIPGSSVKGAIRSAIIAALQRKIQLKNLTREFEFELLAGENEKKATITSDPFKYLKICDAPLSDNYLDIKRIERIYIDKNKSSAPIYAETIKPSKLPITKTTLTLSDNFLEHKGIQYLFSSQMKNNDKILAIIQTINWFYNYKIDELNKKITNPEIKDAYKPIILELKKLISNSQSGDFILHIGKGAGTSLLQTQTPSSEFPKTINLVDKKPIGWLKFEFYK
jgi:CRISPR-associated protein Csm5